MKHWKQSIVSLALAAGMTVSLAACDKKESGKESAPTVDQTEEPAEGALPTGAGWVNGGMTLNVPSELTSLVLVDMPSEDDPDGVLFSVSEKASVNAGAADGHDASYGDGWLFGIRRVDADTLHEMLCRDMSGVAVFARDAEENYYLFTHPTDVRLYRQNDAYEEAMEQWTMLNEWAWDDVRKDFLAENTGLEAYERGNSMLDMYLARAAYQPDANYTLSTLASDPLAPNGVDGAPYAERLMSGNGVVYEDVDAGETPAGEYLVLDFPDDKMRFDFFPREGVENYVRVIDYNGDSLMKITFPDDTKASTVVQEWFDALAAANDLGNSELGYTADDLVGRWAEKIAGRGLIEITKTDEETYHVEINWSNSAFEKSVWEMTATPSGEGGALRYENAKHFIRTFTSDTEYTDEMKYEDGSGMFYLNSANEVMWEDAVDNAGENCVFISVD